MDRERRTSDHEAPWSADAGPEPEPEWAEAIRQARKDRADGLRQLFASTDDNDASDDGVVTDRDTTERLDDP